MSAKKVGVAYELEGKFQYEEFEPVLVHYGRKIYVDYYGALQRARQYAESVLPDVGARKVSIVWDA